MSLKSTRWNGARPQGVAAACGWLAAAGVAGSWTAAAHGQCQQEIAQLAASDAAANDWFGNVAIDGDTIVVGARLNDNPSGVDAGAAYVYVRSGPPGSEVWIEQAKLIGDAQFLEVGSQAGVAVDISGDTALVGSFLWPNGNATGIAYAFVRSGPPGGEVWTQQAALPCPQFGSFQYFGVDLALEGNSAVVGSLAAPGLNVGGQAFFYTRSGPPGGESWTTQQKFPSDGVPGDQFGVSVAMSPTQDTAVVGAWLDDNAGGTDAGSAYVFVKSGGSWVEQAKLTASDGAANDQFGRDVTIQGDTVVVGAYQNDHAGGGNAGAAYVFTRSGTVWTEQAKLTASDAAAGDSFGLPLSLSGDTLIAGAHLDDHAGGIDAGSAYVFTRSCAASGDVWVEQSKLTSIGAGDAFGGSVAHSGGTAVVGAVFDDTAAGVDAGSVCVFDLNCADCPGDADGNDAVDLDDLLVVLANFGTPSCANRAGGDLDGDGDVDLDDLLLVLASFGIVCP